MTMLSSCPPLAGETVRGDLQRKTDEAELMEWKQKYIEQKMMEIETREKRLEEERRCADERMKEIDAKQRLVKCYELMREKELALDEKLDKLRLKEEQQDETKAMAAWTRKSSEILGMFAKELEEFEVKDKCKEKELGEKIKDIELNKEQLKGKSSVTKDNGMPLHLLESMELKGEVTVDAVHPLQQSDLIIFTIEEKINFGLAQLGGSTEMHTFWSGMIRKLVNPPRS